MPDPVSESVLRVCLFTDIVGSTDLKRRLGDVGGAAAIARHDTLFRDGLHQFNGNEEVNPGDGFFATFDVPSDALRFALFFQEGLRTLDTEERLTSRVGIHMGEIMRVRGDGRDADRVKYLGLAVDTAARVMSLAQPEQILLTRHAFDSVRQQVRSAPAGQPVEWRAHGPYMVKGVDDPLEIFEAGVRGVAPLTPPPDSSKASRALAPGEEATLGWRPAIGLEVPTREAYVLEGKLGEGGFGEVWLARHERTRDARAFKFCFQADRLRTLKRELTLFRLLREVLGERDDIARLFEVQLDEAPYFLEMEYTSGGSLTEWAGRQGGLGEVPQPMRIEIAAQIAEALAAAHSVGVIHKDVKPGNVLIQPKRDGAVQARLTDFGIGQLLTTDLLKQAGITMTGFGDSAQMTELSSRTGTRLYMAPEMLVGRAPTIQSDIFSLGVMLYQLIIGDLDRPLAQGWERDVPDELLREDIAACIAGTPEQRLPAADVLARRLRTLDARRAQRAAERAAAERERRRTRNARFAMLAAPLAALASVGATVIWYQRAGLNDAAAAQLVESFVGDSAAAAASATRQSAAVRGRAAARAAQAVVSQAFTDRIAGARAAFFLAPGDFWRSVDGGPLWRHGEWLELCRMPRAELAAHLPVMLDKASSGSPREKYAAFCLLGHLAGAAADGGVGQARESIAAACERAIGSEDDPGVVMAAWWAARRTGREVRPKTGRAIFEDDLTGLVFVRIPAAESFRPGSPSNERGRYRDEDPPAESLRIDSIWVAVTETTLKAFEPFFNDPQSSLPENLRDEVIRAEYKEVPDGHADRTSLSTIRPLDALYYCEWLNNQARELGARRSYRLPTEWEWEYACRGGNGGPFCFGDDARYLSLFAIYEGEEAGEKRPTATRMPNAFGLFDMHGSLWEYCDSPYVESYDAALLKHRSLLAGEGGPPNASRPGLASGLPSGAADSGDADGVEPAASAAAALKVPQRGGARAAPGLRCRSAQRNYLSFDVPNVVGGFRLVMERE